jgi:hypothetical protein
MGLWSVSLSLVTNGHYGFLSLRYKLRLKSNACIKAMARGLITLCYYWCRLPAS